VGKSTLTVTNVTWGWTGTAQRFPRISYEVATLGLKKVFRSEKTLGIYARYARLRA
jgi:hypothetical protein